MKNHMYYLRDRIAPFAPQSDEKSYFYNNIWLKGVFVNPNLLNELAGNYYSGLRDFIKANKLNIRDEEDLIQINISNPQ